MPYTYFPDASGGTEVYVRGLAQRLGKLGHDSQIAAPGVAAAQYYDQGLRIHRFQGDAAPSLAYAYGTPDLVAAKNFAAILKEVHPRIVHLHARTAAVSDYLVDKAHAAGAKVVCTYHTPTVSCARGTMMLEGESPCDGFVEEKRCVSCAVSALGAPKPLARMVGTVSSHLLEATARLRIESKPLSVLRIPGLIVNGGHSFRRLMAKVDHVVAVCQWVYDVLVRNGVPPSKITVSRQGVSEDRIAANPPHADGAGQLSIAYFGRVDHAKGPDLLLRALRLVPKARAALDLYLVRQTGSEREGAALERLAQEDNRIRLLPAVPPEAVVQRMAAYDLIAIPSRCLETGPLVALEAFCAGVPVLGANLGGIAEIVRSEVDGLLVTPDDPEAWSRAIARLENDRTLLGEMRRRIRQPRTMDDVATDMAALYERLLS